MALTFWHFVFGVVPQRSIIIASGDLKVNTFFQKFFIFLKLLVFAQFLLILF